MHKESVMLYIASAIAVDCIFFGVSFPREPASSRASLMMTKLLLLQLIIVARPKGHIKVFKRYLLVSLVRKLALLSPLLVSIYFIDSWKVTKIDKTEDCLFLLFAVIL